ncbi:MAG: hypothetical protein ACWGMZ_12530 [Thermoguttaceae bacterium]
MKIVLPIICGLYFFAFYCAASLAAESPESRETKKKDLTKSVSAASAPSAESEKKYLLRYRFQPGESLRWNVQHHTLVRNSVSGTTETAETQSDSGKLWRVKDVKPDGVVTFEHSVEWVDMRQKLSGSPQVHYDSRTDAKVPPGYADVAASIGAPLSIIIMDAKGKILKRQTRKNNISAPNEGAITIPLPDEPAPVGHYWSLPCDIDVPLETGGMKKIKAVQQFTLESVKTGVAKIQVSTQILTPITDPAIEAKIVQRESTGTVHFDIDAGRVIEQQMDVDKHVIGFRGGASSLHYVASFSEKWIPREDRFTQIPQNSKK